VSRALLEDKELRRAAEALHTVLTRAPDGSEVFLIFPRDRHQLENEGVLRCAVQGPKEVFPSAALPKLLAGEAVADGIAL
jgi:tRNA C32,U32 (ribose-2'-O)-methylase TrmJ